MKADYLILLFDAFGMGFVFAVAISAEGADVDAIDVFRRFGEWTVDCWLAVDILLGRGLGGLVVRVVGEGFHRLFKFLFHGS